MEAGAPVEAKDEAGMPALLSACYHGHEAIARFLVEKGAPLDASKAFSTASRLAVPRRPPSTSPVSQDSTKRAPSFHKPHRSSLRRRSQRCGSWLYLTCT